MAKDEVLGQAAPEGAPRNLAGLRPWAVARADLLFLGALFLLSVAAKSALAGVNNLIIADSIGYVTKAQELLGLNFTPTLKPLFYSIATALAWPFFGDGARAAQFVSILAGSLLVFPTFGLAWTLSKDRLVAYLSVLFVVFNPLAFRWSLEVYPDALYALMLTTAVWLTYRGLAEEATKKTMLGSLFAALAYWTRHNGLLIPLAVVIYFLLARKLTSAKQLIVFLGFFVLFAAPNFALNWRYHGTPLYGEAQMLWVESNLEIRQPERATTFAEYFATRSWGDAVRREYRGLRDMLNGAGELNALFSALVIVGLFSFWQRQYYLLYLIIGLHALFFAWLTYGGLWRYLSALVPLAAILAAGAFGRAFGPAGWRVRWAFLLVWLALSVGMMYSHVRLMQAEEAQERDVKLAADWLREHTAPDAVIMAKYGVAMYGYYGARPAVIFPTADLPTAMAYGATRGVNYLAVDTISLASIPALQQAYNGEALPGWEMIYTNEGQAKAVKIRIFRKG